MPPETPAEAKSGSGVVLRRLIKPFVVIDPYQFEGDVAFGVWVDEYQRYMLGDGDCYNADELARSWPDAVLLTWSELEARLKRTNDQAHPQPGGGERGRH